MTAASAALFFGESAGYNIVEFMTARLGITPFAQHIDLVNITMITFAFSSGFLNTNAILIGQYSGQNSPINVRKIMKISFIASLITFIPVLIIIAIFPLEFLEFFAENDDVWNSNGMTTLVYILCICNFFDFQQSNLQGYLRGLGILNITFVVCFANYCFLLPLMCWLTAFVFDWKLKGVWISQLIVNFIVFVIYIVIIAKSDIEKLCEDYEEEGAEDSDEEEEDKAKVHDKEIDKAEREKLVDEKTV